MNIDLSALSSIHVKTRGTKGIGGTPCVDGVLHVPQAQKNEGTQGDKSTKVKTLSPFVPHVFAEKGIVKPLQTQAVPFVTPVPRNNIQRCLLAGC
jgi:hypothetical protein